MPARPRRARAARAAPAAPASGRSSSSRRRPASSVIRPSPANSPRCRIAYRRGGSSSVISTGSRDRDAEDPHGRLGPRPDAHGAGRVHADRLHLAHPLDLARDVGDDRPRRVDRRVHHGEHLQRRRASIGVAVTGEPPVQQPGDGDGDDGEGEDAAQHDAGQRARVDRSSTPAAWHSSSARSAVAALHVHRGDRVGQDGGHEAEQPGVERGRLHAVVGRQARDDDVVDRARPEDPGELGRDGLARARVAHRERGVAVLAVGALVDDPRVRRHVEVRVEGRAPRVLDAVVGPDPAVLREVRRVLGMPVLGEHDERAGRRRPARSPG